eukprot:646425_1
MITLFLVLLRPIHCWNYDNSNSWSEVYSLCGNERAPPVNINKTTNIVDPDLCGPSFEWDVDFETQTYKIDEDHHTIIAKDGTQYATLTSNTNTIASFPNYFRPETSDHHRFCMDSIHLHWGSSDELGSTHMMNGHAFPLEAHFVHYSCNHPNLETTLSQFQTTKNITDAMESGIDTHQLGVVSVLFDAIENHINPSFDIVLQHLTEREDTQQSENDTAQCAHIVTGLDLRDLIPKHVQSAGYYAYEGALPTAPCLPNIARWHVMNARGSIGSTQIDQLRKLMRGIDHEISADYSSLQQDTNAVYACTLDAEREAKERMKRERTERGIVWGIAVITMLTPIVLGIVCVCRNTPSIWVKKVKIKPSKPKPVSRQRSARINSILEESKRTNVRCLEHKMRVAIDEALVCSS